MGTKQLSNDAVTEASKTAAVRMRLEAVVGPVADVDRANRFYQRLGWRLTSTSPPAVIALVAIPTVRPGADVV
jgi:hypothetical protein